MQRTIITAITLCTLLGCATSKNESTLMDAKSSQCRELARRQPGMYQKVCEPESAGQDRGKLMDKVFKRKKKTPEQAPIPVPMQPQEPTPKQAPEALKSETQDAPDETNTTAPPANQTEQQLDPFDIISLPNGEQL